MGDGTEHIFEGRPEPRGRWGARLKVAVTVIGVIALPAVAFAMPRHHPKAAPAQTEASQPPTPLRTLASGSAGYRLFGRGPFVVYETGGGGYVAVDLGDESADPIRLGNPGGQPQDVFGFGHSPQSWGLAVPIVRQDVTDTPDPQGNNGDVQQVFDDVWLLSSGGGLDDPPLRLNGNLSQYLLAPDGRHMISFWAKDNDLVDVTVVPFDGTLPEMIGTFPTNGTPDEFAPLTPMVWLPDGSWLATPICQCGGMDTPFHWYTISAAGRLARATWLGTPGDVMPGVTPDGRFVSFFEQPVGSCDARGDVPELCAKGPVRILIADTTEHTVREIARLHNEGTDSAYGQNSTALSPDGTLVATSLSGSNDALVLNASSGKTVERLTVEGADLRPVAFVDDSTLVLVDGDALYVARSLGDATTITKLGQGGIQFIGWTR